MLKDSTWSTGNVEIDGRSTIYSTLFLEDSKDIITAGFDGMVRRWRIDDGCKVGEKIQTGNKILSAALSPDGKWLVCGFLNPIVGVWHFHTGEKVMEIEDHTGQINSVDISSDSTKFASGGWDKRTFIWNMATGERLVGPLNHDSHLEAIRFSPNGDRLATTDSLSIHIYDSGSDQLLLIIQCRFKQWLASPFTWSADGRHLFAISFNHAKCFDTSSGSLLSTWMVPGDAGRFDNPSSIALSRSETFLAIVVNKSLSFWDTRTRRQISPVFEHKSTVRCLSFSPTDSYIATGEENGTVTLRKLYYILPGPYIQSTVRSTSSQLPLINIDRPSGAFEAWVRGDLTRAEQILSGEVQDTPRAHRRAQALAHRSLIRSRLKQHEQAIDDAKQSTEIQPSTIGYVAIAIARVRNGESDASVCAFDLVFTDSMPAENKFLLLIKAIILFECGRHEEARLRVEHLTDVTEGKSIYDAILLQMRLLLADVSLSQGDYERAVELLAHVGEVLSPEQCPRLTVISLIFGWNFDGLPLVTQKRLQQCATELEDLGDTAMQSKNPEDAAARYSTVLSLNPSNLTGLLVKRSKARAMLTSWDDSLKDADAAIEVDPMNLWGYERRYVALDALQRHEDAINTLNKMVSILESSLHPDTHRNRCYEDMAFDQLLENIVARSGEMTVLSWIGKASSYNSCLPATFNFGDHRTLSTSPTVGAEMDARIAELRSLLAPSDALLIHDRITRMPPMRFANRRLFLPCVAFPVKKLVEKDSKNGEEKGYRARVSGLGHVEFITSDNVSLTEPRKLVFAYPWIRELCGPLDDASSGGSVEPHSDGSNSDAEAEVNSTPAVFIFEAIPDASMDDYTRALRLVARLLQPFQALLLQQQPDGGFRRIATEHKIIAPGLGRRISSTKDIHTEVLEIW